MKQRSAKKVQKWKERFERERQLRQEIRAVAPDILRSKPGDGKLQMTGQMGDVMKESAQIALTYVRSVADRYGVESKYFKEHDLHLHIPEGAAVISLCPEQKAL